MAIASDWGTKIITVQKTDMTLIQSVPFEIYELDLDFFRLALKGLEESIPGMSELRTHKHNTIVNIGGITLTRVIEIINGYTVTFEDGQYAVNLVGANSNVGDVVNLNQVSVRSANSAGLIETESASGLWSEPEALLLSEKVNLLEQAIHIDTEALVQGDGSQSAPFNTLSSALDYSELTGINQLHLLSDIILDRNLKDHDILGVGLPTVDFNNKDVKNLKISQCKLEGQFLDSIIAIECILLNGVYLNGFYQLCALNGASICEDLSHVLMDRCMSNIAGTGRPSISMNPSGTSKLSVRGYRGGLDLLDCNQSTDSVTIELSPGSVTLDASCTDGTVVLRGVGSYTDNSSGLSLTNEIVEPLTEVNLDKIASSVWAHIKALTFARFIGLK